MKKFSIVYGCARGSVQRKAIEVLSELLLDYTHSYPSCYKVGEVIPEGNTPIYIGTAADNPYIAALNNPPLTCSEEYRIQVKEERIYIEGADDRGLLYGCVDLFNRYILPLEYPHNTVTYVVDPFEKPLPDYSFTSRPSVKNRGIWTWGHVIYDYKAFLDNMVKLKLNTVTIWNEYAPLNAQDIVDYAHSCGIKVIWGYSWGWVDGCNNIKSLDELAAFEDGIVAKYEKEYKNLGGDGIYFQSVTEVGYDKIGDKTIAEAVTDLVNRAAARIFEMTPDLELQFGLHATSVKNRLEVIKQVDPRIRIVWENCGAFPFCYTPCNIKDFDNTVDFVKTVATLRGEGERFGAVTKGLVKLDWSRFEYADGPYAIGVASKAMKADRVRAKAKVWKYIQAYWLSYADKAQEMVRVMAEAKKGDLYVTPLIEDGMFEENIMFPAALMCELLWDPNTDIKELMPQVALRSYIDFA